MSNELKDRLCNTLTLIFLDLARLFILYVDGSKDRGDDTALHRVDPTDGKEKQILYLFKALFPAEMDY